MNLIGYKWKIPGVLLIIGALILSLFYFAFSFRFEIPVLAFISSYKETSFFTCFPTNFADESIMLALLGGLSMIAFSKEKMELEIFRELRAGALINTLWLNTLILLFSVLFIYGSGFMAIVMLNLFLPLILYITIFNIKKYKALRKYGFPLG